DGNGKAFANVQRNRGVQVDAVADDFRAGVASSRAVGAGEGVRADIGGAFGKNNVRAGGLNGDGPLVAGDIPIEFGVILEKAQGIGNGVANVDGLNGVVRIRNVDLQLAVVALAGGFVLEFLTVGIGDAFDGEKQRIVEALRGDVLDGDGAVQAVPSDTVEMRMNGFGDFDRGIGHDDDFGVKVVDDQLLAG